MSWKNFEDEAKTRQQTMGGKEAKLFSRGEDKERQTVASFSQLATITYVQSPTYVSMVSIAPYQSFMLHSATACSVAISHSPKFYPPRAIRGNKLFVLIIFHALRWAAAAHCKGQGTGCPCSLWAISVPLARPAVFGERARINYQIFLGRV